MHRKNIHFQTGRFRQFQNGVRNSGSMYFL